MDKLKDKIVDIANNYYRYLLSLKNVIGVGLGYKRANGINTFEPCIHVLVEKKIDIKHITKNNIIPSKYMGILTDVIEIGRSNSLVKASIPDKSERLKGGISISIANSGEVGTLGCVVSKKIGDKKHFFILSNNHVIADLNKAPLGADIIHPIEYFGGNPKKDVVANLTTFIELDPIKDESKPEITWPINYVDCAIAKIKKRSLISSSIYGVGKIKGISQAVLDEDVKKVGFISGLTNGKILTLNTTTITDMKGNIPIFFKNQITADLENKEGDSGSIVLNQDNKAVGLLYAGTKKGVAFINDINLVLKELKVDLYVDN